MVEDWLETLRTYAKEQNVPIMQEDGISYLTELIQKNGVKRILEIGTAIGYSAIRMALVDPLITIVSIDRDEIRYLEAVKNVKQFGLEERITLLLADALEVEVEGNFDLIFLDAAKAQNIRFFEKFSKHLSSDGMIITDNLSFHGYVEVEDETTLSHNLRGLVRKTKAYITFLKEQTDYRTEFVSVGDGISVTRKNKKN